MRVIRLISICLLLCFFSLSASADSTPESASRLLGQKLMLDFRYFCDDGTPSSACREPVTVLPDALREVLISGQIGGVILFGENIQNHAQLLTLIYQMQEVMVRHNLPPLLVAIDQEGGRVARTPDTMATRFVGNMAIGASTGKYGTALAASVAEQLGRSVRLLGFNVNFAPSVDVNSNPENPVINVRSFGESAQQVARLGQVMVKGMQQQGVAAAIKHFPGHGDTRTDSHTGLPVVRHSKQQVYAQDLLPFRHIIQSDTPPLMIMTAHIQYPALDNSTLKTRDGASTVVPATLSKKILTGVLRGELQYQGVIVTDALDMAGIANYFSEQDAVINTFKAGADIALMPFVIRTPKDIEAFSTMRHAIMAQLESGALSKAAFAQSVARIEQVKKTVNAGSLLNKPLATRIAEAISALPSAKAGKIEQQLANAAVTMFKGKQHLPLSSQTRWRVIMPDTARCKAMHNAIEALQIPVQTDCVSSAQIPTAPLWQDWRPTDVLIGADISPQHYAAEMGGMEPAGPRASLVAQQQWLFSQMEQARQAGALTVFAALRAPYSVTHFAPVSDVALATFGYNIHPDTASGDPSAVFLALIRILTGKAPATGVSPVTVPVK